ncbi:hypothetical protein JOQ06_024776 [Pogonophryne albipinna]|uniref:Profilin n=1 Tax=Pogonophryne albipinna TaxID=1090488 RepID=A0AAD6A7B3_9TELE|nr:hypothetical protein JOQ06_024775 [Pogonophryne albipinna]KAJ4919761.1 hypothetical protein JOQ06_024776 [Pogonophryne albipinna]
MSWDGYITSLMAATDGVAYVSGAMICGLDGSTWATSDNMKVSGVFSLRRVRRFLLLVEFRACSLARLVPALQAGPRCLQPEQVKMLIGDTSTFHQSGPVVAGMKCMLIRDQYDDPSSYCLQLKSKKDDDGNTFHICVGKTNTAVVIAKGTKDANGGQVTAKVFTIVSYLRGAGY